MRTRFAPSPTGYLHLGHVLAARQAMKFAQRLNGICALRMEDTDHTRCKPEYSQAILDDLTWLGFKYTPPIRTQSQHYPEYAKIVTSLIQRGLAYPCQLTRAQIKAGTIPKIEAAAAIGKDWINIATERVMRAAQMPKPALPFAIRLDMKKALSCVSDAALRFEETGPSYAGIYNAKDNLTGSLDPIIARKDIGCSYMIAGPHDDALAGMTHIVRGADLFPETALQVLLQALMDWPRPIYHHHHLINDTNGKKLSKRSFAVSISAMRQGGATPESLLNLKVF